MDILKTQQLLQKVAVRYIRERQNYSKEEIVSKINEIKYLAAQKKVPKLTLRKDIVHLENKLQSIFELEKKILAEEKRESEKEKVLKKQIASLRRRLAHVEDKDLQKKVDKLAQLLAECVAKQKVAEDVALKLKVHQEWKEEPLPRKPLAMAKVHALENRLRILKGIVSERQRVEPQLVKRFASRIALIEEKLKVYQRGEQRPRIKHTLMFRSPPPQKKEVTLSYG